MSTTPQEHRARHVALHKALDELAADWLRCDPAPHHPERRSLSRPILELMEWSHRQTLEPEEPRL